MTFPVTFEILGAKVPAHFVLEAVAYAVAFQVYRSLRRRLGDPVDTGSRFVVLAAAAAGAAVGSRLLFWLDDPRETLARADELAWLLGGKTIVGALLGGLLAVEWVKRRIGLTTSTGDLFAVPLAVGIAVGRVGCFLSGVSDATHGLPSAVPWAMDLGDGVPRHPAALYEIAFLAPFAAWLLRRTLRPHRPGAVFREFLCGYLLFRLGADFLKPRPNLGGLSGIQWGCVAGLGWYAAGAWRARRVHSPEVARA